jgi:hypothetical protein
VTHYDHILPYSPSATQPHWHYHTSYCPQIPNPDNSSNTPIPLPSNSDSQTTQGAIPLINDSISPPHDLPDTSPATPPIPNTPDTPTTSPTPSPRPVRTKYAPTYLSDYVCNHSNVSPESSSGSLYPISSYHTFNNLCHNHHAYTVSITHTTEPKSYSEACKIDCWQKAMNDELEALTKTGTWIMVDLPPQAKPIGSKWVYKVKYKADGTIERHRQDWLPKGITKLKA